MQLVSFSNDGEPGFGIITGESITDLRGTFPGVVDLKTFLAAEIDTTTITLSPDLAVTDVILEPPIPNPGVIWCAGMNTRSHFEEAQGRAGFEEMPKTPMFFLRAPGSVVASGQPIEKPAREPAYDYEGEIALIIGKPCRNVSVAEALTYVAGYSCFNDGSARMYQVRSHQMTTGKNAWRSGSFGPVLATADAVDLDTLSLVSRVNGEVRQEMRLDDLIFSFAELVSHISEVYHLQPGDVIVTGSSAGVGAFRQPPEFLQAGDVVEVEAPGLGTLRNTVVDQVLVDAA